MKLTNIYKLMNMNAFILCKSVKSIRIMFVFLKVINIFIFREIVLNLDNIKCDHNKIVLSKNSFILIWQNFQMP